MKILSLLEDNTGAVSSVNIASAPSRMGQVRRRENSRAGDHDWHHAIRDERDGQADRMRNVELHSRQSANLKNAKAKLAQQNSFVGKLKSFLASKSRGNQFRISESFDMQDVISRLSNLEDNGTSSEKGTVSYGIEDDEGNLMKVTVRADQSEDFESRLADELADAARRKEVTGENAGISMAELLLKLNDEFEILDASFPTIPTDAVYNADKVQYGVADTAQEDIGGEDLNAFPDGDMGGDPMAAGGEMGDPMAAGGEMGSEMGGDPMAAGDDMSGDPMAADGEMGDEFADDGSVEDFPEDTGANPEESLLTAVLKMLTADAEAKKAQADAEAEKARAQQAEYSAKAAKNSIAEQEEVMRMEAEMDKQKAQEKDARKISDLARYRVSKAGSFTEGTKPTFSQFLLMEFEEFASVQQLMKQRTQIRLQYAVQAGDDQETVRYKRTSMATANRELDAKIAHARAAQQYKDAQNLKQRNQPQQPQQNQNPNQNPNMQNNPQPNQRNQQQTQGTPGAI